MIKTNPTIGVFDSGIGGEAVAYQLQKTFPDYIIHIVNDKNNVPYGSKTPDEVYSLTHAAIQPLLGMDVIVIACNTATMLALPTLRNKYPEQKFIGIESMIKTAANTTKNGVVCVCATPATLESERYKNLKTLYASDLDIIEPDCSDWAYLIESNTINRHHILDAINPALGEGADVIVLGCTHYHWIKQQLQELATDNITILEPSEAIGRRAAQLLNGEYDSL